MAALVSIAIETSEELPEPGSGVTTAVCAGSGEASCGG
jgi:hypothetical protein